MVILLPITLDLSTYAVEKSLDMWISRNFRARADVSTGGDIDQDGLGMLALFGYRLTVGDKRLYRDLDGLFRHLDGLLNSLPPLSHSRATSAPLPYSRPARYLDAR